jgi:hypothetical protein
VSGAIFQLSLFFSLLPPYLPDYFAIMDYIDQNPIKAGLFSEAADWKVGRAHYIAHNMPGMVNFTPHRPPVLFQIALQKSALRRLAQSCFFLYTFFCD